MTTQRYARVQWDGSPHWLAFRDGDGDSAQFLDGTPLRGSPTGQLWRASEPSGLSYLAPCTSAKVLGLGYNYKSLIGPREHYDEPVFFLKSPTSLCGHRASVPFPSFAKKVWVEGEVGIIIGRGCRNVAESEAAECILGFTIASDITALNIHDRDWHLARSKAVDSFAPTGPFLVTGLDTSDLEIVTTINGREYQRGRTSDRVQNDAQIVSCLSRYLTLEPWDLILTGTPAGATSALVQPGDRVAHRIDGLGELAFSVC